LDETDHDFQYHPWPEIRELRVVCGLRDLLVTDVPDLLLGLAQDNFIQGMSVICYDFRWNIHPGKFHCFVPDSPLLASNGSSSNGLSHAHVENMARMQSILDAASV
jgi:hypothetical protein